MYVLILIVVYYCYYYLNAILDITALFYDEEQNEISTMKYNPSYISLMVQRHSNLWFLEVVPSFC